MGWWIGRGVPVGGWV